MNSFIPKDLKEWDISIIDKLIQLSHIESETFDFKGHSFDAFKELYADICAMANTSGGFLVLGIDENKDEQNRILNYSKTGFESSKHENGVESRINNALAEIDPFPKVEIRMDIIDGNFFYPVLKIISDEIKKPFFARKKCYVRVNSQSLPASRTTVMNLFNNLIQKKNDIEKLKTSIKILIEQILFTSDRIDEVDPSIPSDTIIPINLDLFRSIIISTDWFFLENNLYGGHKDNFIDSGLYYNLNKIERLNLYIENYNNHLRLQNRREIKNIVRLWKHNGSELNQVISFFNLLISKCDKFLSKL
jgi:hypothetical protein